MGISVKNDEFADMYPYDFDEPKDPHWMTDIQIAIIGVAVMFVFTCIFIKCRKQRVTKQTIEYSEE